MTPNEAIYLQRRILCAAQRAMIANPEDVAQEILLRMLEGRHQKSTISQAVIDYQRRNLGRPLKSNAEYKRQGFNHPTELVEIYHNPWTQIEARMDCQTLIKQLSSRDQQIFVLYFILGLTAQEIADQYDLSEDTIFYIIRTAQRRYGKAEGL